MDTPLPTPAELKAHAKRLRDTFAATGISCSHAQALEAVAHQWGARDWNTLCARAQDAAPHRYAPGQRVRGRYLGHRFDGHIKSARTMAGGFHALTLRFDRPIDVVTSQHFSSLRQQVNCVIDQNGRTKHLTSDGQPYVVIDNA